MVFIWIKQVAARKKVYFNPIKSGKMLFHRKFAQWLYREKKKRHDPMSMKLFDFYASVRIIYMFYGAFIGLGLIFSDNSNRYTNYQISSSRITLAFDHDHRLKKIYSRLCQRSSSGAWSRFFIVAHLSAKQ